MRKPKACPFCESEAVNITHCEIEGEIYYAVQCTDCMNCGLYSRSGYGAVQFWNARSFEEMQLAKRKEASCVNKALDEIQGYAED